jgi:hypothetical protein
MPQTVKVSGPVEYGGGIPNTVKANPKWGSFFSQVSGFTVVIANKIKAYVFVDNRLGGDASAQRDIIENPSTIAHVVGKLPAIEWHVDAEPIDGGQLGLVVYNDRGKALLAGTYNIKSRITKLSTLYPGITNKCKQKASVKATYKTEGGTTVEGEYSVEYEA